MATSKRNNKITNVFSASFDDPLMERILRFCTLKNWSKTRFLREASVVFLDREEASMVTSAKPNGKKKRRR
jgi:hypothetical protein